VAQVKHNIPLKPGIQYKRLTVADNGIGFDQAYAEKIFKTFTRLNAKDKYEGTGLGLSLCKKIVQRHHGTIEATGKLNEGAEFTIVLPEHQSARYA
jgi:signal transduction histidine kinase